MMTILPLGWPKILHHRLAISEGAVTQSNCTVPNQAFSLKSRCLASLSSHDMVEEVCLSMVQLVTHVTTSTDTYIMLKTVIMYEPCELMNQFIWTFRRGDYFENRTNKKHPKNHYNVSDFYILLQSLISMWGALFLHDLEQRDQTCTVYTLIHWSALHTLRVMGCSLAWQNCPCSYHWLNVHRCGWKSIWWRCPALQELVHMTICLPVPPPPISLLLSEWPWRALWTPLTPH